MVGTLDSTNNSINSNSQADVAVRAAAATR
jgi:hypothetical protein